VNRARIFSTQPEKASLSAVTLLKSAAPTSALSTPVKPTFKASGLRAWSIKAS
jgi:hypothetical protein